MVSGTSATCERFAKGTVLIVFSREICATLIKVFVSEVTVLYWAELQFVSK